MLTSPAVHFGVSEYLYPPARPLSPCSILRSPAAPRAVVLALLAALASIACGPRDESAPRALWAPTADTTRTVAQRDSALLFPIVPDTSRTPGATLEVTSADICVPGYSKKVRNVPAAVKRQVYASYGILTHKPGDYEVDHLISLELGGSNSVRNLWPQSYRTHPWNARVKDVLENELHRRVCAGMLDLAAAQRVIASNWVSGYRMYVHPTPPSRRKRTRSRPASPQPVPQPRVP
jgi:hypothetical protein